MTPELHPFAESLVTLACNQIVIRCLVEDRTGHRPGDCYPCDFRETTIRIFDVSRSSPPILCDLLYHVHEPFRKADDLEHPCRVAFREDPLQTLSRNLTQWGQLERCASWISDKVEVAIYQDRWRHEQPWYPSNFDLMQHLIRIQSWLPGQVHKHGPHSWMLSEVFDRLTAHIRRQNHLWKQTVGM